MFNAELHLNDFQKRLLRDLSKYTDHMQLG